jgi:hypothetical protein
MTSETSIRSTSGAGPARGTITTAAAEALKTASHPALSEDLALALLQRTDLPPEVLEQLSRNAALSRRHKINLAITGHPKTPRHLSLPLLRHLFPFEWMQLALMPFAPADVKVAAEAALINRLETISKGEKISLARRASGSVAAALLLDAEPRVTQAALENPRLTESAVVGAILRHSSPTLVHAVCQHPRWSLQREVRIALLRSENTPRACALEYARTLPRLLLKEILQGSRLPEDVRSAVSAQL